MSKISTEKYSKMTNAFMVAGAKFCGHDIPECPCTVMTPPDELIAYCDIKKGVSYNAFAHFYIDDYKFESIWAKPYKALEKFRLNFTTRTECGRLGVGSRRWVFA